MSATSASVGSPPTISRAGAGAWITPATVSAPFFGVLKASPKLFCDETRCPVLDPGRGKTKTGYM